MWTISEELGEQLRCDQCLQSVDHDMGIRFPSKAAALNVAKSFGWTIGERVTCTFCQSLNRIVNSDACPTCNKGW